ncbi:MAG: Glycine-tRNA ligase [Candidatus Uhrbacteria bacterium GW2011_GWA2_52_8d]|uniref:Glycine--tRNA ligase n=1 Tax=Candidatus Uhrbacteria bacterium GW2011_GWA2_52_8d TaxID=1618979 RepID=A0A0G1XK92_9BACT|nr:MAG: Glycine-tRNA ligase [Candidatus Uhrbacteria bacterium GW2011_GWA2_52_8d]
MEKEVTMEKLVALAKTRGFVYPGSDIYGGLANSWDYGPLGTELKRNIMNAWWQRFVTGRGDMVGIDAAVIMNPKVWEASGHVDGFTDPLVECKKCHERFRADQIDTAKACAKCGTKEGFTDPKNFNLLFKTFIGSTEDNKSVAYLRGELAQAMFVDFPQVLMSSRKRVPFGIAQQGKCYRNEITPGNFIFRTREFNLMEFEYFVHESEWEKWFEYWLEQMKSWLDFCGVKKEHLVFHEIEDGERAHYSKRTVDIEYLYPFGQKELYGLAYRTDFDLKRHMEVSGADLRYTDPKTNEKYLPHVIEPTFGIDRTVLITLLEAYTEEQAPTSEEGQTDVRVVLKLPKALAPFKIAILPLSKKDELAAIAAPLADRLRSRWATDYDETQSIGKRYRRQDEIGTPYCVTVDFDSLNDKAVTIRDRDTMKQERVAIDELETWFAQKL